MRKFKTLIYGTAFIDLRMLAKGLYEAKVPLLFDPSVTLESLEEKAREGNKQLAKEYQMPESYFENLKKCTLVTVELTITE